MKHTVTKSLSPEALDRFKTLLKEAEKFVDDCSDEELEFQEALLLQRIITYQKSTN